MMWHPRPVYKKFLVDVYDKCGMNPFVFADVPHDGIYASSLRHMKADKWIEEVGRRRASNEPTVWRLTKCTEKLIRENGWRQSVEGL